MINEVGKAIFTVCGGSKSMFCFEVPSGRRLVTSEGEKSDIQCLEGVKI